MYEMAKVEDLLESMGSSRSALVANNSLEVVLVKIMETREELWENLDAVLFSFKRAMNHSMVVVTKCMKIHSSSKN